MRYRIFSHDEEVNTIEAEPAFASTYCQANGYTFEEAPLPEPELQPAPDPQPTTEDRVAALEEENALLKAQVAAQSDQMDFYEDCIAEMAAVVYA